MPPEAIVVRDESLTRAALRARGPDATEIADLSKWDIFGLGVLTWCLWTLREPFEHAAPGGADEINARVAARERPELEFETTPAAATAAPPPPFPRALRDLLSEMWAHDPARRPTADAAATALCAPALVAEMRAIAAGGDGAAQLVERAA